MSFDQRSSVTSQAVLEDDVQNQYSRCLILLAKRHLYERSAHCHDPNDWGHAFYRALFNKGKESPESIEDGGFWMWLAETSLEKTRQRESQLCVSAAEPGTDRRSVKKIPRTAEVFELTDMLEAIINHLTPIEQLLFHLRVSGHTVAQVAQHLMLDESMTKYQLRHISRRIARLLNCQSMPCLADASPSDAG